MAEQVREIRAVLLSAAILASYTGLVLLSGKVPLPGFLALWSDYLTAAFALWAIVGTLGLVVLLFRHRPRQGTGASPLIVIANWVGERIRRDYGISLFWPPILFATLMAAFNSYKQMILIDAGFGLDPVFMAMDRAIFLGQDPWRLTHALFAHPLATWTLDKAYHGWFLPMSLGGILCAWMSPATFRLRTQYLLTYAGVWIVLGSGLAYLLPAAGPWYIAQRRGMAPPSRRCCCSSAPIRLAPAR